MSAKHTPGPWYATEPFAGFASIRSCADDALVFGIAAGDPAERQDDDTCEANARLIAAAPELAEALRAANRLLWDEGFTVGHPVIRQIDAALAKAGL